MKIGKILRTLAKNLRLAMPGCNDITKDVLFRVASALDMSAKDLEDSKD